MVYEINNSGDNNILNSQLARQSEVGKVTNPIEYTKISSEEARSLLVDESSYSLESLVRYQKDCDIQRFTKMLNASMKEDDEAEFGLRMDNLFASGVVDPFSVDDVTSLLDNEQLLADLGLKF